MLNPHDDALLNDLLDERLTPAEEAAVSARLEREPALRDAWDELVRARELFRDAPDPAPPSDFVARVRARLASEDALGDSPAEAPGAADAAPTPASAGGARPEIELPSRPHVPLAWRRLMTVAYAAAAALVLAIGLFALRDREDRERAGSTETSLARTDRREAEAERERAARDAGNLRDKAARLEGKGFEAAREGDSSVPPPADGGGPVSHVGVPAGGEAPAPAAPGSNPGLVGPGGAVPPHLRAPADAPVGSPAARGAPGPTPGPKPASAPSPTPAPVALPPTPSAPPPPAPSVAPPLLERPGAKGALRKAEAPAVVADSDVLVLEAASVDAGRRLLDSVLAGPGAAPPAGTGGAGASKGVTPVSLRRLDRRRDAALLGALGAPPRPAEGAALPPAEPAPPPPAPAPPPSTPPSSPPALGAPSGPTAAKAPSGAGPVLGVEARELTPDQLARLEALLGPAPVAAGARDSKKKAEVPAGGASKDDAPAPRWIRVLIVLPTPPSPR